MSAAIPPLVLLALLFGIARAIEEPYPPLQNGSFSGTPQPNSGDPLVAYVWDSGVDVLSLQVFNVTAQSAELLPGTSVSSFQNFDSLASPSPHVVVSGAGGVLLDFGTELPAWVEIDILDLLPADLPLLQLGTGEYSAVDVIGTTPKQGVPKQYGTTYRLETNSQLYEGVRFGFIFVASAPSAPFTITGFRAVVQTAPTNYTGSFSSPSSALLEKIYYAAAYTVRTNLLPNYMGAILEDRGDRISWAGDAHVAQATLMSIFGDSYAAVVQNLVGTGKSQNGIASYSLYFCDSVLDYYAASRDAATLNLYLAQVKGILEGAWSNFDQNVGLNFFGWDDRLGSGFQVPTQTFEAQWDYRMVAIALFGRFSGILNATGDPVGAAHFAAYADGAMTSARATLSALAAPQPWYTALGMHASGEAINTHLTTDAEQAAIIAAKFNDTTIACSLSNFNQYWLIRALANAGALDRGVANIQLCWGAEIAMGGTTFWEISSPDWVAFTPPGEMVPNGENGYTSLCHPWSSGPTAWLAEYIIGVRRLAVGSALGDVLIAPHVTPEMAAASANDGLVRLAGAVPVPLPASSQSGAIATGLASVAAHADGSVRASLPAGVDGTLILSRLLVSRLLGLEGDGEWELLAEEATITSSSEWTTAPVTWVAYGDLPAHVRSVYVAPLEDEVAFRRSDVALFPLAHGITINVTFSRKRRAATSAVSTRAISTAATTTGLYPPYPPPSWPVAFDGSDFSTQGSWVNTYGSAGYALFGFDAGGVDRIQLPPFIQSITPRFSMIRGQWASGAEDVRAMQDPRNTTGPRSIGYLASSLGGDPTFAVDILSAVSPQNGTTYTVAAYLVDWDGRSRRQTVALLDGLTLDPISPIVLQTQFDGGVWFQWTVPAGASVRIRVSQSRGDNAVLSAIAFGVPPQ